MSFNDAVLFKDNLVQTKNFNKFKFLRYIQFLIHEFNNILLLHVTNSQNCLKFFKYFGDDIIFKHGKKKKKK